MKNHFFIVRKKCLSAAIAAAILGGAAFGVHLPYAAASEVEPIYYGNKNIFALYYLTPDETKKPGLNDKDSPAMTWTFDGDASVLKGGIASGVKYWSEMLGAGAKNPAPIQILIRTEDEHGGAINHDDVWIGNGQPSVNASAMPVSLEQGTGDTDMDDLASDKEFARLSLQNGDSLNKIVPEAAVIFDQTKGKAGFFTIGIGKWLGADDPAKEHYCGWYINDKTLLAENEAAADFVATIRHEMGHALGIITPREIGEISNLFPEGADINKYTDQLGETLYSFSDEYSPNSFASHFVDERGRAMKPGMIIADPEDVSTIIEMGKTSIDADMQKLTEDDFFYLSKAPVNGTTTGKAYFVGKNVSEVLGGAKFDGVDGLPVNGWENDWPELSHIQTQGMMSHVAYSNYTTFLEAEIAVMQDIGYKIDRRNYYGASIYHDGATIINTQGYSARSADGTAYLAGVPNQMPLGVGLHIYGAKNDVTQAADILTVGTGAVGIRVDGSENNLTVAKGVKVCSDGENGTGLLVSYGKNQEINQAGTITARGADGRAVRFDFGSSSNGARDEYRGSYIQYRRKLASDYSVASGSNLAYDKLNDELKGPLVKNFNLTGTLIGGKEAIYIGKNAFVENINILGGAQISGDIKSDWLDFDSRIYPNLKIVTAAGELDPAQYIPSLTTNLNFNADIDYGGNISGARNIRLNVAGGELNYSGAANVVSVSVADGAAISGGDFTLNYFSAAETEGSAADYDAAGTFTNRGTVAASAAGDLKIAAQDSAGKPISDAGGAAIFTSDGGTLVGYMKGDGNGVYKVNIAGKAALNGSHRLSLRNALPGEKAAFAEIFGAENDVSSFDSFDTDGSALTVSGMLGTETILGADGQYYATVFASDNLGARTAAEQTAYDAMGAMSARLNASGDSRRNEMRTLYGLDAPKAKAALAAIGRNELAPTAAVAAQDSTLASRVISSRLAQISAGSFVAPAPIKIPLVPANYRGEAGENNALILKYDDATTPFQGGRNRDAISRGAYDAQTISPALDEGGWIKFSKNWGDFAGGADYHSSAISGGYDWQAGKKRREGVFAAYSATALGGKAASAGLYDTRVGYYTGWENRASSAFAYADLGHLRTHTRRGLTNLGLTADGRYSGNIYEIGGEYKYDTAAGKNKTWHVSPFIGLQYSHLRQSGYAERGAGIYNQEVAKLNNDYFAGEIGAEFKRGVRDGSYTVRLGVRRAFAGSDPTLRFKYSGDGVHGYCASSEQDKTHCFLRIGGDLEIAQGWTISGEAEIQRGPHSRDALATVSLRRMW